ncbi:zinc finger protein 462-like isoform X2 [Trachinotus anak]
MVLYHCNNCKFSHKSVVVMHVHYQKSHPEEAITIDKIKQSAHVTSHITSQMMPENSVTVAENSTPPKDILDSSKKAKDKAELSLNLLNLKHTPDASENTPKPKEVKTAEDTSKTTTSPAKRDRKMSAAVDSSCPSSPIKMFYCQFCSYSSTNIRSVAAHHNIKHAVHGLTGTEEILLYSAEMQKKLQSETEGSASTTSSDSKTSKRVEVCSEKELQHEEDNVEDASMSNPYLCPENLFYCQRCNYGNPTVKGVLNHQAIVHQSINSSCESILEYTALIRDEIENSKSNSKDLRSSTHLPLPLLNEGDEFMVFCPFCNYRQNSINHVLKHCFKRHHGFEVKTEEIHRYTAVVLKQAMKFQLKTTASQEVNHASHGIKGKKKTTKMLYKDSSVSASPSVRATQTQRNLKCHRCAYSSQCLNHLRRHMWRSHRTNRSITELLRWCFEQGMVQSGYHCDICVFSHITAAAVHKHYQEQHPQRKLTFKYIYTRLHVGPDIPPPGVKEPKIKQTDDISAGADSSSLSERLGRSKTKRYSCRACSFRGHSMSSIAHHYRAVHPWTLKEDGSVLNVITSKKPSANSHVEDHNEMPASFDTRQGKSHGSSGEASESPPMIKCHLCPAKFHTRRGLNTHCGMKHQEAVTEKSNGQQGQQGQIQTRVHVFKCPYCLYINTNYHGVLTHCQMRHPASVSRADSLHVDETHLHSLGDSMKRKGPGDSLRFSGYMCKTCPQICATLEKLNKHCENDHNETVPNTLRPASKPSAVRKTQQSNTHSSRRSALKAPILRKKIYAVIKCQCCSYSCSTRIALMRHFRVHHRNASVPGVREREYKCVLCPSSYFMKKRLGSHYIMKHGKDAYLKYYPAVCKQVPENSALTSPDSPLAQLPKPASEVFSTTTEENKILVYRCPKCPYVNASHHGTLTHCQMKHPALVARADELKTDEILVTDMVRCTTGKGSNKRGYMCKKCPQIHESLIKLKIHRDRDHNQAESAASEHSADSETEKQPCQGSEVSVLEAASLKNRTSSMNTTDSDLSQQPGSPETYQPSVQNQQLQYECHMCTYAGACRKYLYCHYKNTHRLDSITTYKVLEKYNKRKRKMPSNLPKAATEEGSHVQCKKCPNLTFDSSHLLIDHYGSFHSSDCKLDFTVLSQRPKKSTGVYKCAHCNKLLNGIRKLCHHLDRHRAKEMKKAAAAEPKAPFVIATTPETTSTDLCRQDELPMLETVEELTQWNVTPIETFTLPESPLSSPSKPTDLEQPEQESSDDKHTCKQCGRKFMSLKGLRSHERSHAALAAIKKLNNLPTSALKLNINKYVLYKSGTLRPFLCGYCSYRTTVLGLWKSHFMKNHHDVIMDRVRTDSQDKENAQRALKEPPNSSEDKNNLAEPDEEPEVAGESLYLEPPDVQRQLDHYSLMAQTGVTSNANLQETELPENSLLHCEFCNFSTEHLSSMRRHYLNRHGKKVLRCKDCNFVTGLRKTLEMHVERGHATCQSEPTHQKDLRCPFCLYQTKNKNNMIDHIVLHREERVVPIEVRRPKLSRYLQGIVFRCHKCTFTSGSAENLRSHMRRHNDIKPFKCRLCYFDCILLSDLEAHLSDKHQVERNHELVGQVCLDQLKARVGRTSEEEEEPSSNSKRHKENEEVETEEFVADCNEGLHETQAENPADNKQITLQTKEAYPKHEWNPQGQAGIVYLSDTARGQQIEDIVESNVERGNYADIQFEECNSPEREKTTNDNQARPRVRGSEDSGIMFTQQKEEAAEGSSATCGKIAVKTEAHKLHIKAIQHRTLNIEARVEENILRHILVLDKDDSIRKIHTKADQDRTVKIEQNSDTDCGDNTLSELAGEEGSITLARDPKLEVNLEAEKNHMLANNSGSQESFKVERHSVALLSSCAQLKMSHKESSALSLTNCKEEQLRNQTNSEEATDLYGEMPVLENEYLKEVSQPLGCCKEEEEDDHPEQRQDKEDEGVSEASENRCKDQEHEEGDGTKEADSAHVHKSVFTETGEAAEVLCPLVTEKKLYTCELCGRNLTNSTELKRHIMRHGM